MAFFFGLELTKYAAAACGIPRLELPEDSYDKVGFTLVVRDNQHRRPRMLCADLFLNGEGTTTVTTSTVTTSSTSTSTSTSTTTTHFTYDISEMCSTQGGWDRFEGLGSKIAAVKFLLAMAVICLMVAVVAFDKTPVVGLLALIAAFLGMVAMSVWVDWYKKNLDDAKPENGIWMVVGGWLSAAAAVVLCIADRLCCREARDEAGKDDDEEVTPHYRAGIAVSVTAWLLMLLALSHPSWTVVKGLGPDAGDFCVEVDKNNETDTLCKSRRATFGLWQYCVEEQIDYFGNGTYVDLCMDWDDEVQLGKFNFSATTTTTTTTGPDATTVAATTTAAGPRTTAPYDHHEPMSGDRRFLYAQGQLRRGIAAYSLMLAVAFGMLTAAGIDFNCIAVFSMVGSTFAGIIAMGAWIAFQTAIGQGPDGVGDAYYATGGWLCVGSWMVAAAAVAVFVFARPEDEGSFSIKRPNGRMRKYRQEELNAGGYAD